MNCQHINCHQWNKGLRCSGCGKTWDSVTDFYREFWSREEA